MRKLKFRAYNKTWNQMYNVIIMDWYTHWPRLTITGIGVDDEEDRVHTFEKDEKYELYLYMGVQKGREVYQRVK